MVPHRQALRIAALAALASPDQHGVAGNICNSLSVKFPKGFQQFVEADIFPFLTPDVESCFKTTDFSLVYDYRPLFIAAKQLGIEQYLSVGGSGPTHCVPEIVVSWRQNSSIRIFMETCLLCKIPRAQILEDANTMYGVTFSESDLTTFENLFVDMHYANGDAWLNYILCIGNEEAMFKRSLMNDPKDYVRWRLHVPVSLNSERVLDRLVSDAYYTIQLIKSKAGERGVSLTKDQRERIKLETDTIYKGLDRRVKLKELERALGSGKGNTDAALAIREIILDLQTNDFVMKQDLPTLDQLGS